jgi:ABC-type Fe3+/spermidine/putrescine transport system ATPase subunit
VSAADVEDAPDGSRAADPVAIAQSNQPPAVELVDVYKQYGRVAVLRKCSLSIERGQFLSLLGPSGSGKTTILRIIAGLVGQDEGTVRINGTCVDGRPPNKRPVNTVFQNYALFPHRTVLENVRFPLDVMKVRRSEGNDRANEMLRLVALSGVEKKSVTQLSGGQAQRVALARALAGRPEVLLLDEPLNALDLKLRQAMQSELRRIHDESGTTFIFVTHDQGEALAMSDRVVLLRDGEIVQDGTPQALYDHPRTPFASDFLGAANLVRGTVQGSGAGIVTLAAAGLELSGQATVPLKPGDDAVLSIRPERILVTPLGTDADAALSGTVRRTVFLGHLVRCVVELQPELVVTAEGSRDAAADWAEGARVAVEWSPGDALVMQDAETH